MEKSLIDDNLTLDNYSNYIEKILIIFRLSSKNSSILFDLKIDNYKAIIKLSIVSLDGEREDFQDYVTECDSSFYHQLLIPLIRKIADSITICTRDIVKLPNETLSTFRMISENNDLFTIDGLSDDDANGLLSIFDEIEKKDSFPLIEHNHNGFGNISNIIVLFGLVFLTIIVILLFTNR